MKFLEVPIEWFLNMAWDKERWTRNTHREFLALLAKREFGDKYAERIGDILARYSVRLWSLSGTLMLIRRNLLA
jgi:hypothetical protein